MYVCLACRCTTEPSEKMRKHLVYKDYSPREIARELPVCRACDDALKIGIPFSTLKERTRKPVKRESSY